MEQVNRKKIISTKTQFFKFFKYIQKLNYQLFKYIIQSSYYQIKQFHNLYFSNNSSTKIGRWIELNDGFTYYSQVIYNGEYINSKKVGQWDAFFRNIQSNSIFEKIGGGLYDEDGINKIGRWIELSDGFRDDQQVKYVGDYKNGKKIGMWTKMERNWQKIEDGFRKVKQERYDK